MEYNKILLCKQQDNAVTFCKLLYQGSIKSNLFFQILFSFFFFHKFCFFHFYLMELLFFLNATMGGCGTLFSLFFTLAVDPSIHHSKYYVTYFLCSINGCLSCEDFFSLNQLLIHPHDLSFFPPSLCSCSSNRGAVCNVLLTCCKDSVCRLWAETLLPGDNLLSSHHNNPTAGPNSDINRCAGTSRKNNCNGKAQGKTGEEVS